MKIKAISDLQVLNREVSGLEWVLYEKERECWLLLPMNKEELSLTVSG